MCHSMLHHGLLKVTGSVDEGLRWTRHALEGGVALRDTEELHEVLEALAAEVAAAKPANGKAPRDGSRPSAGPDEGSVPRATHSPRGECESLVDELAEGLKGLGRTRREGEKQVRWAIDELMAERRANPEHEGPPEIPYDDRIFRTAMLGK